MKNQKKIIGSYVSIGHYWSSLVHYSRTSDISIRNYKQWRGTAALNYISFEMSWIVLQDDNEKSKKIIGSYVSIWPYWSPLVHYSKTSDISIHNYKQWRGTAALIYISFERSWIVLQDDNKKNKKKSLAAMGRQDPTCLH